MYHQDDNAKERMKAEQETRDAKAAFAECEFPPAFGWLQAARSLLLDP
jgi:hypothetical protein